MDEKVTFKNIGCDRNSGQELGSGLWIVPCRDLTEKQFVVCLRGDNAKELAEANPEYRYSEALNGYYRYLSAGKPGKEIVVSFRFAENSRITVSLEKWKMDKGISINRFIDSVYLIKNFANTRVLEKA